MRKIVAFSVFVASCVAAYLAYQNAQINPQALELSRTAVCDKFGGCSSGEPTAMHSDVFQQRFEWRTVQGKWTATCKRKMVLVGTWKCEARRGPLNPGRDY